MIIFKEWSAPLLVSLAQGNESAGKTCLGPGECVTYAPS